MDLTAEKLFHLSRIRIDLVFVHCNKTRVKIFLTNCRPETTKHKKCRKHKNTSFSSALMLCTVRVCRVSQLASLLFYFFSFSSSVLESKFKGSAMRIKNLCQEDLAKAFLALTNNKKFRSFYQKHLFQIQPVTTNTKSQKSQK